MMLLVTVFQGDQGFPGDRGETGEPGLSGDDVSTVTLWFLVTVIRVVDVFLKLVTKPTFGNF